MVHVVTTPALIEQSRPQATVDRPNHGRQVGVKIHHQTLPETS